MNANTDMNDDQLLRYSRQIMLPEIDAEGQLRLAQSTVLLVGAGGLGSACSIYLAAGGVGHIILTDFDHVDLSNLQRQVLYNTPMSAGSRWKPGPSVCARSIRT